MYRRSLIPFVAVLPFGSITFAQNWINPAGGSWGDTTNWAGGALPGAPVFNLNSATGYTVTLPASYMVGSVDVQTDITTINLNGFALTTPILNVGTATGQNGTLTLLGPGLVNSTGGPDYLAGTIDVGTSGGTGQLIVNDATIFQSGDSGSGFDVNGLTVENGASINLDANGSYSISNGIFNDGSFQAGLGFFSDLSLNGVSLTNGSSISALNVTVGNATLDDSVIGTDGGGGGMAIEGTVTASDQANIASEKATVSGTVNLLPGSSFDSGDMTMAGGTISIELNSQVSDPISEPVTANNGTLEFTLQNGFEPAIGEVFPILYGPGEDGDTGTFANLVLPALPAGESWDTSDLYTTGDISVVPEPVSVGLISMGLASLALRRRRDR